MCLVTKYKHLIQKKEELEKQLKGLEVQNAQLDEAIKEYQEILETGWEYPDITIELPSPRDIVPKSDIRFSNGILSVINLPPHIWIADVTDTNSEDPFFDINHSPLLAPLPQPPAPYRYEDLRMGDVCVYQMGSQYIIHRIVKIEQDNEGRKYVFRGDNTVIEDPYTIRDKDIKYLMVGVIY